MDNNKTEENGNNVAPPLKTLAGAEDKPLKIGDLQIPCYVLEDETRVISQRGLYSGLGTTSGGNYGSADDGALLPRIAQAKWLQPYISEDLRASLACPIEFTPPHGGRTAYGYPATAFVELCDAILKARDSGTVENQQAIVKRADIILRGLAVVGIISLIDETTGYQAIRIERALAQILEKYIAEELQRWIKTYPMQFYEEICRLKKWPTQYAIDRPSVVGHFTNDIVYDRLAPGVRDKLCELNPVLPDGRRQHKHHQWLTPNDGHLELQKHLESVISLMTASKDWGAFKRNLTRRHPKPNEQLPLLYDD